MRAKLARLHVFDIQAARLIARNDRISDFAARHAFPDGFDDPRGFVAKDGREDAFRVLPGERVRVRVAQRRVRYFHPHFALLRRGHDDGREFERRVRGDRDRGRAGNLFNFCRQSRHRGGGGGGGFESREGEGEIVSQSRVMMMMMMRLEMASNSPFLLETSSPLRVLFASAGKTHKRRWKPPKRNEKSQNQ